MPAYEYKVVPAPTKGVKAPGVKGAEARFSHALQELMNSLAAEGWEYQRAETLPSVERAGLTGSTTEWRNVLVFKRLRENAAEAFTPELLPPPAAPESPPAEPPVTVPKAPELVAEKTIPPAPLTEDEARAKFLKTATNAWDKKAESKSDTASITRTLEQFASNRKTTKTDS